MNDSPNVIQFNANAQTQNLTVDEADLSSIGAGGGAGINPDLVILTKTQIKKILICEPDAPTNEFDPL